jgi:cytochrome b
VSSVAVWDVPVRLFHWGLVLLIATQWITAELDAWETHKLSGYAVLTLVLFRIAWGFVGTRTARFATFVRGPAAVRAYARGFWSRTADQVVGHNPMGALSVLALLTILLAQTITGLFAMDRDTGLVSGPLSHLVSDETAYGFTAVHEFLFGIVQVLVALHVLAVLFYLWRKRENLIWPMIVGSRRLALSVLPMAESGYARRALLVLVAVVALVTLLVTRV